MRFRSVTGLPKQMVQVLGKIHRMLARTTANLKHTRGASEVLS